MWKSYSHVQENKPLLCQLNNTDHSYYCLLKSNALTLKAQVGGGVSPYLQAKLAKQNRDSITDFKSLLMHVSLSTDHHLLGAQFITSQKANICTTLIRLNRIENNRINLPSRNMTAFQPTVFLT
jgi:hypothetical protein